MDRIEGRWRHERRKGGEVEMGKGERIREKG